MDEHSADRVTPETLRPVANEPLEAPMAPNELKVERFVSKPPVGLLAGMGALTVGLVALVVALLRPVPVTDVGGTGAPTMVPGQRAAPAGQPPASAAPASEGEAKARQQIEAVGRAAVERCLGMQAPGVVVSVSAVVHSDGSLTDASVGALLTEDQATCVIGELEGSRVDPSITGEGRIDGLVEIPSP